MYTVILYAGSLQHTAYAGKSKDRAYQCAEIVRATLVLTSGTGDVVISLDNRLVDSMIVVNGMWSPTIRS